MLVTPEHPRQGEPLEQRHGEASKLMEPGQRAKENPVQPTMRWAHVGRRSLQLLLWVMGQLSALWTGTGISKNYQFASH